jgi:multidrug resistance efflux pump
MFELMFCSALTILPDFLYRRYVQGKRIGREITLYSVWYELRYGITMCLILTISLITVVFYYHPATRSATSYFRTVTIMADTIGNVTEVYVGLNDRVEAGDPIFKMESATEEAQLEEAIAALAGIEADLALAQADLISSDAQIAEAMSSLQQAQDELETKIELSERNADVVTTRELERLQLVVEGRQAGVDGANAAKASIQARIDVVIPAQRAGAEAQVRAAQVALERKTIYAGVSGRVTQFTLRVGDLVNPMIRPAGILIPDEAGTKGLAAGFSQIEAQVMRPGMTAEAVCFSRPYVVIPMVVTDVQPVIATGQITATDRLIDPMTASTPGTVLAYLEPMFEGGLEQVPPGSTCIVNAYTSNHERLVSGEELGTVTFVWLHAVDAVGLVHALLLRIQALVMPVQTLVLKGH